MTYVLLAFIAIGLVYLWLTRTIKKAVVQPVMKNGKLLDPLLSEKPRWKAIKEDHGVAIGFWLGLGLGLVLLVWFIN